MNYLELNKKLFKEGKKIEIKNKITHELIDESIKVDNYNLFWHYPFRLFEQVKNYLLGELSWYMSGNLKPDFIIKYSKFWSRLLNKNGTLNSNYGYHVFYKKVNASETAFQWCVNQLKNDVNSRQAIILYNQDKFFNHQNKDFICTQLQHFIIRDNKLINLVYIRSSDIILGLTYDIPWWSLVQQQLFLTLKKKYSKLQLGDLVVHGGSFHYYQNKHQLIQNIIQYVHNFGYGKMTLMKLIPLNKNETWYEKNLNKYIKIEKIKKDELDNYVKC